MNTARRHRDRRRPSRSTTTTCLQRRRWRPRPLAALDGVVRQGPGHVRAATKLLSQKQYKFVQLQSETGATAEEMASSGADEQVVVILK